jgi:hypothetical protein
VSLHLGEVGVGRPVGLEELQDGRAVAPGGDLADLEALGDRETVTPFSSSVHAPKPFHGFHAFALKITKLEKSLTNNRIMSLSIPMFPHAQPASSLGVEEMIE